MGGFVDWLFSRNKEKTKYHVPLNGLSDNEEIKALRQQVASLQGQLGKYAVAQKQEQEGARQQDKEQEAITELHNQKKKLDFEDIGPTVSLVKFILKAFRLSPGGKVVPKLKIDLTDADDHSTFGQLGDIQVSTVTGNLILADTHMNPYVQGDSLSSIIFRPDTIASQLKRNRFALPRDKDFNPIIDVASMLVPDVAYDEDSQEYVETIEYRKKVRELLIDKENKLRNLRLEYERLEKAWLDSTYYMKNLESTLRIYTTSKQVDKAEMSKMFSNSLSMIAAFNKIQSDNAVLLQKKVSAEELRDTEKDINQNLKNRIVATESQTSREQGREEVFTDLERAKNILPERVPIELPASPQRVEDMPGPGDKVGARRNLPPTTPPAH